MFSTAQTLTEAQKQEALQTATKFCNLVERFCAGERTSVMTQINAMFSGNDCSVYDDVKNNSETALRNYLSAIQLKYPKSSLATSISSPKLSQHNPYIEPSAELLYEWQNIGNSELTTNVAPVAVVQMKGVNNVYILFDVVQKYPTLGKSTNKKIIYSIKNKKIVGFIANEGSMMNYLNGLMSLVDRDYKAAMSYFDKAASIVEKSGRDPSMKKKNYSLAMACAALLTDFRKAAYYAEKAGNKIMKVFYDVTSYCNDEKWDDMYPNIINLESLIKNETSINNLLKSDIYGILGTYYIMPIHQHNDKNKGIAYFEKADSLGSYSAGYTVYQFNALYLQSENEFLIDPNIAFEYLQKSANRGYPPAFYEMGCILENLFKDKSTAIKWYEKSAQSGNHLGMANYGKLLIESGNKTESIKWLTKALEGNSLELALQDYYDCYGFPYWPKSRTDVEMLLRNQISSNGTSSQNSSSSSSVSSATNDSNNNQNSKIASIGGTIANAVDLGLSVKWASHNLGSSDETKLGARFAWGETKPKNSFSAQNYSHCKVYRNSTNYTISTTSSISSTSYDAASENWGTGWSIPTCAEWSELCENCAMKKTVRNGEKGILFTSRINGNSIFLPVAPVMYDNGETSGKNCSDYWAADNPDSVSGVMSYRFYYNKELYKACSSGWPEYGKCIRAVYR